VWGLCCVIGKRSFQTAIFSMKAVLNIVQFAVGLRGLYPQEQVGWCSKYCLRGATFRCMKKFTIFFPVVVCNAMWDDCERGTFAIVE